mmetsp:Transcript_26473/g.34809  ORF Transcript_26473/g.34809 Transcript_26473/m.34809 type:complete len:85 (-) Transcript_26473:899-1153(-)
MANHRSAHSTISPQQYVAAGTTSDKLPFGGHSAEQGLRITLRSEGTFPVGKLVATRGAAQQKKALPSKDKELLRALAVGGKANL